MSVTVGDIRVRTSRNAEADEEAQEYQPAVDGNKGAQQAEIQKAGRGQDQTLVSTEVKR